MRTVLSLVFLAALLWASCTVKLGRFTLAEHVDRIGQTDEAKALLDGTRGKISPALEDVKQRIFGEYVEAPTSASMARAEREAKAAREAKARREQKAKAARAADRQESVALVGQDASGSRDATDEVRSRREAAGSEAREPRSRSEAAGSDAREAKSKSEAADEAVRTRREAADEAVRTKREAAGSETREAARSRREAARSSEVGREPEESRGREPGGREGARREGGARASGSRAPSTAEAARLPGARR